MSSDLPPIPDFPTHLPTKQAWPYPPHAERGLIDIEPGPIDFTPVPRRRQRRDGWTEDTQRMFIMALEDVGGGAR